MAIVKSMRFLAAALTVVSVGVSVVACSSYHGIVRDHYDNYLYTTPKIGPKLQVPSDLNQPGQVSDQYPVPSDFKAQKAENINLEPPMIINQTTKGQKG